MKIVPVTGMAVVAIDVGVEEDRLGITEGSKIATMSPRLKKPRHYNCPYRGGAEEVYKPAGTPLRDLEQIIVFRDEIEAMFLCDSEDLSQEEAGKRMGVSRGTVQRLLAQARKKTIEGVVLGKALMVESGETKHKSEESRINGR